jgi:molybdenum cofactor cytidylyltransferase
MVSGIILASGFSRRMRQEKLLLSCNNMPLIERIIRSSKQSLLDEIILIYQNEKVKEIGERYKIKTVFNGSATEGQSAAIRLGVQCAHPVTDGFMFMVGDQPYLTEDTINLLITEWRKNTSNIIVPAYCGRRGNPVIFPRNFKEELLMIQGDTGGRAIIEKNAGCVLEILIDDARAGADIDTAEEYEFIRH